MVTLPPREKNSYVESPLNAVQEMYNLHYLISFIFIF